MRSGWAAIRTLFCSLRSFLGPNQDRFFRRSEVEFDAGVAIVVSDHRRRSRQGAHGRDAMDGQVGTGLGMTGKAAVDRETESEKKATWEIMGWDSAQQALLRF